jgi:hypothetical protein
MAHEIPGAARFVEGNRNNETLYILGGVALMILGVGPILLNRNIRKALSQSGIGNKLASALPDIERHFRWQYM